MTDASSQDAELLSVEKSCAIPRSVTKTVKMLRSVLVDVGEREKAFEALKREHEDTKRENDELKERLHAAEEKIQSTAFNRCDLVAALLQRFTCSGDLNLLISMLTETPTPVKEGDTNVISAFEKPLLVVHRLQPPDLSATFAAAAAAAMDGSLEAVVTEAAVIETPTDSPLKVEPDAEKEDRESGVTTRKRSRDSDAEEVNASSLRAWFRGSGVRTRQSSRSLKKSL